MGAEPIDTCSGPSRRDLSAGTALAEADGMRKLIVLSLAIISGLTAGGCHDPPTFSCFHGSLCKEYDNWPEADVSSEKSACTELGGRVVDSCGTENLLGTCTIPGSGQGTGGTLVDFAYDGYNASQCAEAGGTWAAP
jgi:hypothetical protein